MNDKFQSVMRIGLFAGYSASATWAVLYFAEGLGPKVHGIILAALAIVFVISDRFFPSLLTGLDAIRRSGSMSEWQLERLRAVIDPAKKGLYRQWVILAVFKAIAGACGGLLALEKFVELPRLSLMTAGYASLFLSLPIVFSIYRNFRTVEALQNRIGREESERKEKKRLIKEIETGAEHTYATDDHLASYTKPAA